MVLGISAWYLRHDKATASSRRALSMTVVLMAILAPTQLVVGDLHGLDTFKHQPEKVAAMEGIWETQEGAPLLLFAIPSQSAERNFLEIGIPKGASLILTHELDGEIRGLKEWAPEDRPHVATVFWSFRIMVGLGLLMIVFALAGVVQLVRGRLYESRRLLRIYTWMIPAPFIAVLAGWFVTEVGRQPWLVHGIMRVEEGITPSLTGGMALFTLIGFILVYSAVFVAGVYYLGRVMRAGPESFKAEDEDSGIAKRPLANVSTRLSEGDEPWGIPEGK